MENCGGRKGKEIKREGEDEGKLEGKGRREDRNELRWNVKEEDSD